MEMGEVEGDWGGKPQGYGRGNEVQVERLIGRENQGEMVGGVKKEEAVLTVRAPIDEWIPIERSVELVGWEVANFARTNMKFSKGCVIIRYLLGMERGKNKASVGQSCLHDRKAHRAEKPMWKEQPGDRLRK